MRLNEKRATFLPSKTHRVLHRRIGQTNVNVRVDMTFARDCGRFCAKDPDVVMVASSAILETANRRAGEFDRPLGVIHLAYQYSSRRGDAAARYGR